MRYTKRTQEKLHDILKAQSYMVRYERGSFEGGYCIVQNKKVVVINKFYPLEGKIGILAQIIKEIEVEETLLTASQLRLLKEIKEGKA